MTTSIDRQDLVSLTANVVAAHVSGNTIAIDDIPPLIRSVYKTLASLEASNIAVNDDPREPAVPVIDSVNPDYLICLEDGKKLKLLKRHLKTAYGMTPEEYRLRWNLPADYPMVAPNYAKKRSELARDIGLGTQAIAKKA
ncbi:MAG: MucR family transcriptional regulator [Alphaproteobacteria bacterium]|nr:MucR family transcriptional regulator [Alphaproteobacteria bacterium]